jgi:N-acetyl-anhydromuramyl-L-alanine amidase AmpD
MPEITDPEQLKEIKIGQLNDISFDLEDPLVTNEYDGQSLFTNMVSKFLGRESAFNQKRPHKGIVLLSSKVQTAGITGLPGILKKPAEFFGVNKVRNFAIVRVPEIHGHIPLPDMAALASVAESYDKKGASKYAEINDEDKLLLSMHDPYFSAPIDSGDMPQLKPGDIVLLDGDGVIIQVVEPAEVGFAQAFLGSIREKFGLGKPLVRPAFEGSPYGLPSGADNGKPTPMNDPDTICFHWSATFETADDAIGALRARTQGGKAVSYHYIIGRDGRVAEVISPEYQSNSSPSSYRRRSIDISFAMLGFIEKVNRKTGNDINKDSPTKYAGRELIASEFVDGADLGTPSKWFHKYSAEHINAAKGLVAELVGKYPTLNYAIGHEDIQGDKEDPGPLFDKAFDEICAANGLTRPSSASEYNFSYKTSGGGVVKYVRSTKNRPTSGGGPSAGTPTPSGGTPPAPVEP